MNPGLLNKKVEIWRNELTKNEDGELEPAPRMIKRVWAQIVPKTGSLLSGRVADTTLSKTTHQIKMRYSTAKGVLPEYWLIYKEKIGEEVREHRFDIDYIQNPLFKNNELQIFCQEVI